MNTAVDSITIVLSALILGSLSGPTDMRMCYFQSEARKRNNVGKFEVKDIDFTLCTHYIYASAMIHNASHTIVARDPSAELGPNGLYRQFVSAKRLMPSIKTMVSVGGIEFTPVSIFASLGVKSEYIDTFARSVITFLVVYGFDGLDVDWVHPSTESDKKTHTSILKALHREFTRHTLGKLILTSTGHAFDYSMLSGYEPTEMAKYVDYTIIKTNNLYLSGLYFTYFYSPLFAKVTKIPDQMLCVSHSVEAWKIFGMPYHKQVVGVSAVGTFLELADVSSFRPGSNITKKVLYGPLYRMPSTVTFPEICQLMSTAVKYVDPTQKNPYLVKGKHWFGYEDHESIQVKLEWLKSRGVAGIMFAALDEDDFTGEICKQGKYPLLSYLKSYGNQNKSIKTRRSYDSVVNTTRDWHLNTTSNWHVNTTSNWLVNTTRIRHLEDITQSLVALVVTIGLLSLLVCSYFFIAVYLWRGSKRAPRLSDEYTTEVPQDIEGSNVSQDKGESSAISGSG